MDKNLPDSNQHFIIFKTEDNSVAVDVLFQGETVWLTLDQMAMLFERDKSTISRHIKNIFEEGELERTLVAANFATTASDGCRTRADCRRGNLNQRRCRKEIKGTQKPNDNDKGKFCTRDFLFL